MTETVQLLPSLGQERLLFLQELTPNDTAYNIGIALSFEGPLDKRALFYACKTLMRYHDSLRMTFSQLDGKPIATISPDVNIDINQIDCSKVSIDKGLKEIYEKFFKQEISKVFNLEKGPLIRHTLLCFNPNLHILIMSCHHIIFDGWSMMVYLKELAANYQALIRHQSLSLTPVTHFYRDFIVEQRARMQGVVQEELLEYWKHQLAHLEPLILPTDKPRNRESPNIKKYDFNFSTEFSQTLRQLSQEKGVTLYTILFSAFCSFLFRHSGQEDFSIGVPMHGRNKGNFEDVIGFFINTLPIRVNLTSNKRFATLVEEVKVTMRGALMHQEVPLSHLITELKLSRDINRDPLFPVMFTMENFQPPSLDFNNLNVKMVGIEAGGIPCAISLEVHTYLEDFLGVFKYDANLFKKSTIHRMVGHWLELLKGISQNYDQAISQLPLLTALERKQLLIDWNKTEKKYPKDKTIHQLFEEQAERTPDNVAVVFEGQELTYKDLNERANQLAHYLRKRGVKPDTLVAIAVERSLEMIIGLLGILKAGGAYVPLDPSYPQDRLQFMLEDTQASFLLTQQDILEKLPSTEAEVFLLDKDSQKLDPYSITNPSPLTQPHHLAYVIYTSGSTGKPKGVMIEHRSILNLLISIQEILNLKQDDGWLALTPISFDISGLEIYLPLIRGAFLVVTKQKGGTDPDYLKTIIHQKNVSIIQATPSTWRMLLDADWQGKEGIKILTGGEALPQNLFEDLRNLTPHAYNVYGPTETTIWSTLTPLKGDSPTIGKPMANTQVYILDASLNPIPIGVIGELCIGGAGLARGYLNRPDLTREKFIDNPFVSDEEKAQGKNLRLYRTGDLCRWLEDGHIEYIGRIDHQVKIRGFRIECGEIEQTLLMHPAITQAVVIADESEAGKQLVAYFVAEKGSDLSQEDLVHHLSKTLPDYMVPSVFMPLASMPLTSNGKLDRKALPKPEFTVSNNYTAPRNELEHQIRQIWAEMLGLHVDRIGIADDFFILGGNSILAIKLVSKLNNYYKSHLKVADIFVYKNIELLSSRIAQTKDSYQTVVKLNNTYDKPNMFMIHPGGGGCEQYTSLADLLTDNFSCYGIDPYNIYHENKIDNINELAKYYLYYIDEVMNQTQQEVYHLLGWSLGGKIALEIAYILEQRDCTKIKVYLLDTFLNDNNMVSLMGNIDLNKRKSLYRDYLASLGYEKSYIEKAKMNYEIEYRMMNKQKVSSTLRNTQVLLYKAMLQGIKSEIDIDAVKKYQEYLLTLEYNNIDKILIDQPNLTLIKVNAHHENILKQKELIASKIIEAVHSGYSRRKDRYVTNSVIAC